MLLVLSTFEDNEYPQYVKSHTLPNYKIEQLKVILMKNVYSMHQLLLIEMVIEPFCV